MQNGRDPSVWRSLAVAFGDGVAFGVGMKLTQNAPRNTGTPASHDSIPEAERLAEIERRLTLMEHAPAALGHPGSSSFDRQAMEALLQAVEARLKENSGQMERRLADLEARIALEFKSLRQQDQALADGVDAASEDTRSRLDEQVVAARRKAEEGLEDLRQYFLALHREFAEAVARIVEAQIAGQLETTSQALKQGVEFTIEEKVEILRDQLHAKDREIGDVRQRLVASEGNVLDIILGMGDLCRQMAGRMAGAGPGEAPSPETPENHADALDQLVAAPDTSAAPASGVPGFAQVLQEGGWKVPLVSSFLLTAGGFFLIHFL